MKKLIIVPAYNEERNIDGVLRAIRADAPGFDVVVVNDGSGDKTSDEARAFPFVQVIDLPVNLGKRTASPTPFLTASKPQVWEGLSVSSAPLTSKTFAGTNQ